MKVFTVTELTSSIKEILEPNFRGISLKGEISNFKKQSSGHLYFNLKDASSQISAAIFRGNAASLAKLPKDGDQVIAKGEISLYVPRGQYQIIIRELQFLGQGELLLKLHELKNKLQQRGWFDPALKKKIPKFPKKIGIVTSPTGAVIQDILNVLTRRFSGFHVILNPVKVQGEGASLEIAKAIDDFNKHKLVDLLIVGRGGGSIEDLWAFNEEIVAKAIFESEIPVISAVGHETDITIADFVADVRAPTPSAAAEIAVSEKAQILKFLEQSKVFLKERILNLLRQKRQNLQSLQRHPFLSSPDSLLSLPMQKLDEMKEDLERAFFQKLSEEKQKVLALKQRLELTKPSSKITEMKARLISLSAHLDAQMSAHLRLTKEKLFSLSEHLKSLNPNALMKKGYSILKSESGHVLLSAKDLTPNQYFKAYLHDGRVDAVVNEIQVDDKRENLL